MEYGEERVNGFAYNLVGDVSQYASLLWGLSAVLQNDPKISHAIGAGIIYAVAGGAKYLGTLAATQSDGILVRRRIGRLERNMNEEPQDRE